MKSPITWIAGPHENWNVGDFFSTESSDEIFQIDMFAEKRGLPTKQVEVYYTNIVSWSGEAEDTGYEGSIYSQYLVPLNEEQWDTLAQTVDVQASIWQDRQAHMREQQARETSAEKAPEND